MKTPITIEKVQAVLDTLPNEDTKGVQIVLILPVDSHGQQFAYAVCVGSGEDGKVQPWLAVGTRSEGEILRLYKAGLLWEKQF